jgi:hypothetical protein
MVTYGDVWYRKKLGKRAREARRKRDIALLKENAKEGDTGAHFTCFTSTLRVQKYKY